MRIAVTQGDAASFDAPALVVNLFGGVTNPTGASGVPARTLARLASNLAEAAG